MFDIMGYLISHDIDPILLVCLVNMIGPICITFYCLRERE